MSYELIYQLTVAIIVTTIVSYVLSILKQPLIGAYIISGTLLGPGVLNIIKEEAALSLFSDLGIAFLLFMVGLELNIGKLKDVGRAALFVGTGQILFTSIIGYYIALFLGFPKIESIYLSIALTFSSTIIVVKLLSDKEELETLYGRIVLGILLVQDFVAIVLLMFLSGASKQVFFEARQFIQISISGAVLILFSIFSAKYVIPPFFNRAARSQELLFLSSIAWCLGFIYLSNLLSFSVEVGAFLAGVTLASLPYYYEISGRIKPLRDFFVLLFFIILGARLNIFAEKDVLLSAFLLSFFVLIGNPIILMAITGLLGYTKRTSFFAGLGIANISEFSLILIALGSKLGHVQREAVSAVTFIGLITFVCSTYFIIYNHELYSALSRYLSIFERKKIKELEELPKDKEKPVILFGCRRLGYNISEKLSKMEKNFTIVDFNPEIVKMLKARNLNAIYGDATNIELLEKLKVGEAKMVISTLNRIEDNLIILRKARGYGRDIPVILTATKLEDALELYKNGASYVVLPHFLGGELTAELIERFDRDESVIPKIKQEHFDDLIKLKEAGIIS